MRFAMGRAPLIALGMVMGGPEFCSVYEIISDALVLVDREVGPIDANAGKPLLNVVFYVSGSVERYDHNKIVEVGRYSRKKKLLIVAVPVPAAQEGYDGTVDYVVGALRTAIQIGADVLAKKCDEPFDREGAMAVIDRVEAGLRVRYPTGRWEPPKRRG
jgi:hypothetical protein